MKAPAFQAGDLPRLVAIALTSPLRPAAISALTALSVVHTRTAFSSRRISRES